MKPDTQAYTIYVHDESNLPADERQQPVHVLTMQVGCTFDQCLGIVKELGAHFKSSHRITVTEVVPEVVRYKTLNHWQFGGYGYNTYSGDIEDKMRVPQNDSKLYGDDHKPYVHLTLTNQHDTE